MTQNLVCCLLLQQLVLLVLNRSKEQTSDQSRFCIDSKVTTKMYWTHYRFVQLLTICTGNGKINENPKQLQQNFRLTYGAGWLDEV